VREKAHLVYLGVDGRVILKRILKNRMVRRGLDSSGSGSGHVVDGKEPSGAVKCGEFLE
jgi:hypothetical protein